MGRAAARARTALWRSIAQDSRPVTIVCGDYYLFADSSTQKKDSGTLPRLILDPSITSHDDLDIYLMRHPTEISRFVDEHLHYVPTSAIIALGDIFSVMLTLMIRSTNGTRKVIPWLTKRWYFPNLSTNPISVGRTILNEIALAQSTIMIGIAISIMST